jgi:hypothetical protein
LLNDHDQNVRILAAAAVGDLARHSKVFPDSFCCPGLTSFEAVFRPSIKPVVLRIAELLKDSEWKVRFASIYTIIKLAEEGTKFCFWACRHSYSLLDAFRDSITNIVPQSAESRHGHGQDARSVAVTAVCDLITQSKAFCVVFSWTILKFIRSRIQQHD